MARIVQTHKESPLGYNTKDDPISLNEREVSSLVNAYPSIGSPKPREGTTFFSANVFPDDIYFSFPYEDDDQAQTIIAILNDGSIWGCLKQGSPFQILPSVASPTGTISYVLAAKAIFLFSDQEEFNFIIEQTLSVAPFFEIRKNFVNAIPWDGALKFATNHQWKIETSTATTNMPSRSSNTRTSAMITPSDAQEKELNANKERYVYKGYCYSLVRREDDEAFDTNGNPVQTKVWNTGVIESPIDYEAHVRFISFKRDPESDTSNNIFTPDYSNSNIQALSENDYVLDKGGIYYKATKAGNTNVNRLDNPEYFVTYDVPLDGSDNDAKKEFVVHLPTQFAVGAGLGNFPINRANVDPQITHLRLYATLTQGTPEEARGATFRFLVDLPIESIFDDSWVPGSPPHDPTYLDDTTDAELSGSDNAPVTFGVSKPPLGTLSYYHNGKIWIGGVPELQGRFFSSLAPTDAVEFKKFLTLFKPETEWIDTNQDTGDTPTGIGETTDFLIFLMKRSVWGLFRGDIDSAPIRLSTSRGCPFPKSIAQSDKTIFYLSAEGPAIIAGQKVELLKQHKAGECWPITGSNELLQNGRKTIFKISEEEKKNVLGWYHRDCYFFSYQYVTQEGDPLEDVTKTVITGFYLSPVGQGQGAWEVQHADSYLDTIAQVMNFGNDKLIFRVNGGADEQNRRLYTFLDDIVKRDLGLNFTVSSKSKRYYANPEDRNKQGQLYDMLLYARYEDAQDLSVAVFVNKINIVASANYFLDSNENPQDLNRTFRNNIRFGFPEGVFGNFFEIEWSKVYDKDFHFFGWDMRYHQVRGAINKFVSTDSQILIDITNEGVGEDEIQSKCNPLIVYPPRSN